MRARTLITTAAVVGALGAAATLPATASATVICVDDTPGTLSDNLSLDPSCKVASSTLSLAVSSAQSSPEPDTVLIGPGAFTLPAGAGPSYYELAYASGGANTLQLRGAGPDRTQLVMGSTTGNQEGLRIEAPPGSSISALRVTIPKSVDSNADIGIDMSGGVEARDIMVDGPTAYNARAIVAAGRLSHVRVDLPTDEYNSGVLADYTDTSIVDSSVQAELAVVTGGNKTTIERSTLKGKWGTKTDSGTMVIRDSVIDLGNHEDGQGVSIANDNAGSSSIAGMLDGLTVVGGGAGSAGIRVMANNGSESAKAQISNTVIAGPPKSLEVLADNGRPAEVVASYSNFAAPDVNANLDGTGATGTAVYTPSSTTDLPPGFVDPAAGDYHLAAGSPLIDLGDPASPPAGELDIDGQARAASSRCPNAAGRRDIGADEFAPLCAGAVTRAALPDTTIRGPNRIATRRKRAKASFKLSSSEPGASFECSVDGRRFKSCAKVVTVRLRRGKHTIRARAIGKAGADPTPAIAKVKVVKRRPTEGSHHPR